MTSKDATPNKCKFLVRLANDHDIEAAARVVREALATFWASVGQAQQDSPVSDSGQTVTALHTHPQQRLFVAVGINADGEEEDVLGVYGVNLQDPIAGMGPLAVSTSRSNQGVGRALMSAAIAVCEQRGKDCTMSLLQDSGNTASFALNASQGFRCVEMCSVFEGYVPETVAANAIERIRERGSRLRRMEQRDVPKCDDLFGRALGYSRLSDISEMLERAGNVQPCIVAVRDSQSGEEEVLAYSTSCSYPGHVVAEDEEHYLALVAFGSNLAMSEGRREVIMRCLPRLYPSIVQWALQARLRLVRQSIWMAKGGEMRVKEGFVYAPSTKF